MPWLIGIGLLAAWSTTDAGENMRAVAIAGTAALVVWGAAKAIKVL